MIAINIQGRWKEVSTRKDEQQLVSLCVSIATHAFTADNHLQYRQIEDSYRQYQAQPLTVLEAEIGPHYGVAQGEGGRPFIFRHILVHSYAS